MKKIYIIQKYTYSTKITDLFAYAFESYEKAKNFIATKINEKELVDTLKKQNRGLLTKNEFLSKKANYKIKELIIK